MNMTHNITILAVLAILILSSCSSGGGGDNSACVKSMVSDENLELYSMNMIMQTCNATKDEVLAQLPKVKACDKPIARDSSKALGTIAKECGIDGIVSVRKEKISGVSQKGPFLKGSKVVLHELNLSKKKTGKSFDGATTDDDGNFEIVLEGNLASPYAMLEVNGWYKNEVTNSQSSDTITLRVIADISSKSYVNINVLTHLEYERVLKLLEDGFSFENAKKEALEDVLNELGIDAGSAKSSDDMNIFSDSTLSVASIMVQGERTSAEVSDFLASFSEEIKVGGTVSAEIKAELESGFVGINVDSLVNALLSQCGGSSFDNEKQFCYSKVYGKCGGLIYDPTTHICVDDVVVAISKPLSSSSSSSSEIESGTVSWGNKTYKTVVIGTQTWMAENLDFVSALSSGDFNSWCYDGQAGNCTTYGRLYDWATAMALPNSCNSTSCAVQIQPKHRGICPSGWHIPNDADWDTLMVAVGGEATAGTKLKAKDGWNDYLGSSGNGTDDYGFSALPGGHRLYSGDGFGNVGAYGYWWSSSEYDASIAYHRRMIYNSEYAYWDYYNKPNGFYVRCLRD